MNAAKLATVLLPAALLGASCSGTKGNQAEQYNRAGVVLGRSSRPLIGTGQSRQAIPAATAMRLKPDLADKVAVTFGPDGRLSYFPAPSDISADSAPLPLGDGWYLNRQGISANSVFTRWTFSQYAALPSVPTREEIKEAVIPGSRVTEMTTLPFDINRAAENLPAIKSFLNIKD